MSFQSQPAFYAVIPATVRYCKALEMGARLLYGEITALCNKEGYCWSTNGYFAALYEVSERTIRRWIKSLVDNFFIETEANGEAQKSGRAIYIYGMLKILHKKGGGQKCPGGMDKNVPHNNTGIKEEEEEEDRCAKKDNSVNSPKQIKEVVDQAKKITWLELTPPEIINLLKQYPADYFMDCVDSLARDLQNGGKIKSVKAVLIKNLKKYWNDYNDTKNL